MRFIKLLFAAGALALISFVPQGAKAADYDTDDTDYPLRYFIYPIHAYGKGIEYFVTRPINWVVSQPRCRYVFGNVSHPRTDDYWGDFDLYQRYSY